MNFQDILIIVTILGIVKIIAESSQSIKNGKYSLDYIALAAMLLALFSGEYLAGAIVAVMFAGGKTLELYAVRRAHRELETLADTIPKKCLVEKGGSFEEVPIREVREGDSILVKRGEIAPLDGTLVSPEGTLWSLANLTGESAPAEFPTGAYVRSGSENIGDTATLRVSGDFSTSTYRRLVHLVEDAKRHPARTVRLSEKANIYFTAAAFIVSILAYALSGDPSRILAVLVIATPCPLLIAAPVAFVAGMSRAARAGIILRRPSAFEAIDTADTVFFDKTGTLTLGRPEISAIGFSDHDLAIAASLQIHSLHPIARAIVDVARARGVLGKPAEHIEEKIGSGISGIIGGKRYSMKGLSLFEEGKEIAVLSFADVPKEGANKLLGRLAGEGVRVAVITGDSRENAEKSLAGYNLEIFAGQSPEDKHRLVEEEKKKGKIVAMIGDGLNDAPALALADAGIVFSGTENGASIEAADVAVLGSGLDRLGELFSISRRTMRIAKQSIYGGIALSLIGMIFAAAGRIVPSEGAILQEIIDVVVILNALRALSTGVHRK